MQEPRCQQCGCAYSSHNSESRLCRTRRARWDDTTKSFVNEEPCRCSGYRGDVPTAVVAGDCVHEFVTKLDPYRCVHCLKYVSLAEQKKGVASE